MMRADPEVSGTNAISVSKRNSEDFPALDALRFFAALLVMLTHLRVNQFLPYSEVNCSSTIFKQVFFLSTRLGLESVIVFFVLSGFLVGGKSVDRYLAGTFDGGKYFIDRFTRIYTPFVPILALTIGVCIWYQIPFSWLEALLNLLSLQGAFAQPFSGNMSLWSLSYEVWFYILCGAILLLFQRKSRFQWGAGFLIVASIVVFSRLDIAFLISWIIGLGAYFVRPRRIRLWTATAFVIICIGVILMQITSVSKQVDLSAFKAIDRSFAIVFLAIGFGMLSTILVSPFVKLSWATRFPRLWSALASFSFTLYLTHIPAIIVMNQCGLLKKASHLNYQSLGIFGLNALNIVIVSYVLYLAFERHTPRIRSALYCIFGFQRK